MSTTKGRTYVVKFLVPVYEVVDMDTNTVVRRFANHDALSATAPVAIVPPEEYDDGWFAPHNERPITLEERANYIRAVVNTEDWPVLEGMEGS